MADGDMITLSKERFDETIGTIERSINKAAVAEIEELAAIMQQEGQNELLKKLTKECGKLVQLHNDSYVKSMQGLVTEFHKYYKEAETVEKAEDDIGEVKMEDVDFNSELMEEDGEM